MTEKEQSDSFDTIVNECKRIMTSKAKDYSNDNKLSNFELVGDIVGIGAPRNCLCAIATKVARLGILLNPLNPKPNHESIKDTVLDLTNYSILLRMILDQTELDLLDNETIR